MIVLAIRNYFARVLCSFTGHARGCRLTKRDQEELGVDHFVCPRCGTTWTRKARKAQSSERQQSDGRRTP